MPVYYQFAFAAAGDRTAVPTASQPDGSISYTEGYGIDYSKPRSTDPDALTIERVKFNQLIFDITQNIQQYQQHGYPEFITAAQNGGTAYGYAKGAIVRYDAGSGLENYVSLANANTALPSTASWAQVSGNSAFLNKANTWTAMNTFSGGVAGALTGNATTATALQTARTINGVSFNGTANITIGVDAGSLTGANLAASVVNSSLTSVGIISSGTWNGTIMGVAYGGTGSNTAAGARGVLNAASLAANTFTGVQTYAAGAESIPSINIGNLGTGFWSDDINAMYLSIAGLNSFAVLGNGNTRIGGRAPVPSITLPGTGIQLNTQSGRIQSFVPGTGGNTHLQFFNDALNTPQQVGSIVSTGSATTYNTGSDYRLKKDFTPIKNPVERLKLLNPCEFAWKINNDRTEGFIAHEVQPIVPSAVTGDINGVEIDEDGIQRMVIQQLDPSKMIALLTAALQAAFERIETLEANN